MSVLLVSRSVTPPHRPRRAFHPALLDGPVAPIEGDAAIILGPDAVTSVGEVAIDAAGDIILGPDTLAATGGGVMGEGAPILGPDTLDSVATAPVSGSASITELPVTITAAGTVFGPIQSVIVHVSGVNSATLVFPQPLTAGSMIHLAVVTFQSTAGTTITTPTDTLGHTYQPTAAEQDNSGNTVHLRDWYVPGCSAGANTITVDISGAGLGEISACGSEWPGREQVSPLSGTPSLFGPVTTTDPDTGDMLPSHDGSLLIAVLNAGGVPAVITEEAGWRLLREYEGDDSTVTLSVVWKLQPIAALDGASWTVSPTSICLARVAAFRPAGIPGITGVAAIALDPDVVESGLTGGSGSRMMLMGVGR